MLRNIVPTSHYEASIAVSNLPNGNYIVKVTGAEGEISKEVVVSH